MSAPGSTSNMLNVYLLDELRDLNPLTIINVTSYTCVLLSIVVSHIKHVAETDK